MKHIKKIIEVGFDNVFATDVQQQHDSEFLNNAINILENDGIGPYIRFLTTLKLHELIELNKHITFMVMKASNNPHSNGYVVCASYNIHQDVMDSKWSKAQQIVHRMEEAYINRIGMEWFDDVAFSNGLCGKYQKSGVITSWN